jgi:hypothetical protein
MAETLNKDELLGKALGTKLAVSPAAEAVSLKAPEPVAAPVDFSAARAEKPIPVKTDYMAAVKPDIDALRVAEEEKLKFAGLEKIDTAQREAAKQKALGESAAQQRREILDDPSRAEYKRALEDKAKPFIPHEENAQDLMTLFGLLNVVGFAIGAGGKEYSQAAMSAMNGMLEGHQKGRDDLYKREKSIFETNQKQLDSRIKQLLAFMQDNELLTNMDKTARDQAIQGKFLEDGATFLSDYYQKNGYGKTVETLKEMVKASGKAAELVAKETQRAADQDFTLRLETQKAKEAREQDRNKVLAQYDLASLKLNEEAKQAKANRDFRLEEELSRRAFEIEKAKADWTHGENLAEINRKAAADIELARIERDKLRDRDTAEYRLKDKEYQEKRLKLEDDRYRETVRHDKALEGLRAKEIAAKGGAGGQKATQQMFVVQRAVNALGGVASAVEALGQLPSGTTGGILPNLQTKDGMFNYMRNAASRTMSSSESKAVETLFTGITRNLAAIEASGAATGLVGLATQIEKLRPVAGDKAVDVALKMADIRRIATENIQPLIDSGLMPKQQADVASGLVKRIERAIPYTTQEVVNAAYGGKGKQTISEAGQAVVDKGRLSEAQQKRMRELEEKERAAK